MAEPAAQFLSRPRGCGGFHSRRGRVSKAQRRALREWLPRYQISPGQLAGQDPQVFRGKPLTVEIGSGDGGFLLEYAQQNPEQDCLAIEADRSSVGKLLAGIHARELRNVHVMDSDALEIFRDHMPAQSVSLLCVFFPDPWASKRRHLKRRLLQEDSCAWFAAALRAGGRMHFATDWEEYARQALEVCERDASLSNVAGAGNFSPRPAWRAPTRYEQRGLRLGHAIHDLCFAKNAVSRPAAQP